MSKQQGQFSGAVFCVPVTQTPGLSEQYNTMWEISLQLPCQVTRVTIQKLLVLRRHKKYEIILINIINILIKGVG